MRQTASVFCQEAHLGEVPGWGAFSGWIYVVPFLGPMGDVLKVGRSQTMVTRIRELWGRGPWRLKEAHPRTFWAAYVREAGLSESAALTAMSTYKAYHMDPAHPMSVWLESQSASVQREWLYNRKPRQHRSREHGPYKPTNGWTELFRCDVCVATQVVSCAIKTDVWPLVFDPLTSKVSRASSDFSDIERIR